MPRVLSVNLHWYWIVLPKQQFFIILRSPSRFLNKVDALFIEHCETIAVSIASRIFHLLETGDSLDHDPFGVLGLHDLHTSTMHPVSSVILFTFYPILSPSDLWHGVNRVGILLAHTRMEQPARVQLSEHAVCAAYAVPTVGSVSVCSAVTTDRLYKQKRGVFEWCHQSLNDVESLTDLKVKGKPKLLTLILGSITCPV